MYIILFTAVAPGPAIPAEAQSVANQLSIAPSTNETAANLPPPPPPPVVPMSTAAKEYIKLFPASKGQVLDRAFRRVNNSTKESEAYKCAIQKHYASKLIYDTKLMAPTWDLASNGKLYGKDSFNNVEIFKDGKEVPAWIDKGNLFAVVRDPKGKAGDKEVVEETTVTKKRGRGKGKKTIKTEVLTKVPSNTTLELQDASGHRRLSVRDAKDPKRAKNKMTNQPYVTVTEARTRKGTRGKKRKVV